MIGSIELEKWICEETWFFQQMLQDLDYRLALERIRLIEVKFGNERVAHVWGGLHIAK